MSEMLGNRYFIAREFEKAVPILETALLANPALSRVRKKLIISYTQVDRIDDALDLFLKTLEDDPRSIIDTDLEAEDCPCPHLCSSIERRLPYLKDPSSALITLGILELFCDIDASRSYISEVTQLAPDDSRSAMALTLLKKEKPACRN